MVQQISETSGQKEQHLSCDIQEHCVWKFAIILILLVKIILTYKSTKISVRESRVGLYSYIYFTYLIC